MQRLRNSPKILRASPRGVPSRRDRFVSQSAFGDGRATHVWPPSRPPCSRCWRFLPSSDLSSHTDKPICVATRRIEAKAIAQWDRADRNLLAANDAVWQSLRMKLAELDRSADPADIEMQLQIIERAKPFLEQARAHDPDLPFMRQRWGMVFYFHGRAALRSRDWRRAAEDLESAAVTLEKLAEDRPDQHEAALFAARSRFEQARLAMLNSPNEAEKKIREAIGRFEKLGKISSIKAEACFGLAEACRLLADFLETQPQRPAELADPARGRFRLRKCT